jgi:hypothetical protein
VGAASRLPQFAQTVVRSVQTESQPVRAAHQASPNAFTATDRDPEAICLGTVPVDLLSASPFPPSPVTGTLRAARHLVAANAAAAATQSLVASNAAAQTSPLPTEVNASPTRPRSYLEAARSPPVPLPASVKLLKPLAPAKGCFRCLALDHLVADCREPVRCKLCRAYGHKSPQCKMKLKVILHAVARRLRTPAAVRAARARPEPAALEPLPPSDYPSLDFEAAAAAAYDPANMVPSSSLAPLPVDDLGTEAPTCVDKFILDSPASPVLLPLGQSADVTLPAVAQALDLGTSALGPGAMGASGGGSSNDEYASGELDSGSGASGSSWQEGRPRHADA